MSPKDTVQRTDIDFQSGGDTCRGWLYLPQSSTPPPVIVMAHGLGGLRTMRLDAYAERFAAAGYACLVFDYRYFGDSSGEPRQLISVKRQLEDWRAAAEYARSRPDLDGERVVLWGTSFSGGHVVEVAAGLPWITAVISQGPFSDGISSCLRAMGNSGLIASTALALRALGDVVVSAFGGKPVLVPLIGPPGTLALMASQDAHDGYTGLVPQGDTVDVKTPARVMFDIMFSRPGRFIKKLTCPALLCVCKDDSVAPSGATLRHARKSETAEIRTYDAGHFDIYIGRDFEIVIADQIDFLRRQVPLEAY